MAASVAAKKELKKFDDAEFEMVSYS